ncbi:hypothetical protein F511_43103 [Dorcoceras hygrometricum]|uniref:Enoyl reductase (ER) domain-containing protein n=1 Tax=Dorcoceras hygrometricum TaxID=472368 RepID=A0A2Z7A6C1_9LAMI|nr:hypothetical protein F511_43103 [Dorcoceras hygrometricum]
MIQVAAAGLDIFDTWCREGASSISSLFAKQLGYECSGNIVAIGSKVSKFKEGDEVCAILGCGGGYAEFVVVPESHALLIPSGVPLVLAAALPLASHLTFYTLSNLTDITADKSVLIHEAAGGVGTVALQYAKHVGCEVFAVVGTEQELQVCQKLGATFSINYKIQDFCERVKAETGEKGVDIVLDLSGRDNFQKNLYCLARDGSLVTTGHHVKSQVDVDLSILMEKNISVIGGNFHILGFPGRMPIQSDVAAQFWPLIEAGHIKPIIGKIFNFSEAQEAHRALEEKRYPGKMLLIPGEATLEKEKIQVPVAAI